MVARVGIFDSGVGGLSVARALHRLQPALDICYLADTAFFPYGGREPGEVAARAQVLARRLLDEGAQALVVACNTASSAALDELRATFDVPIVGMEPPLKPAVLASRSGVVAVLATPGTASGERLARLHERYALGKRVFVLPMPGLADLVEAGEVQGPVVEQMLRTALDEPLAAGIDALALGCTHYPFLRPVIEQVVPASVQVIEASEPVARRVLQVLAERGIDVEGSGGREVLCYATGDAAELERRIQRLIDAGAELPPIRVPRPVG